jgi:hypothetical protein
MSLETKRRSRKYTLAVWGMVLITAIVVGLLFVTFTTGEAPDGGMIIATFGGIGIVLGAYGATNVAARVADRPSG